MSKLIDVWDSAGNAWNRTNEAYTGFTIFQEFKTGQRSLFGLDGCSLLLMGFSIAYGAVLLLFGLVGSKFLLPAIVLFIVGAIFLSGDQFVSPLDGRIIGANSYRTGWSPGYVWFVSLVFAGIMAVIAFNWTQIPLRLFTDSEPFDGRCAILAPLVPQSVTEVAPPKTTASKPAAHVIQKKVATQSHPAHDSHKATSHKPERHAAKSHKGVRHSAGRAI